MKTVKKVQLYTFYLQANCSGNGKVPNIFLCYPPPVGDEMTLTPTSTGVPEGFRTLNHLIHSQVLCH